MTLYSLTHQMKRCGSQTFSRLLWTSILETPHTILQKRSRIIMLSLWLSCGRKSRRYHLFSVSTCAVYTSKPQLRFWPHLVAIIWWWTIDTFHWSFNIEVC